MKVIEVEITREETYFVQMISMQENPTDDFILGTFNRTTNYPSGPAKITIKRLGEYDCLKK